MCGQLSYWCAPIWKLDLKETADTRPPARNGGCRSFSCEKFEHSQSLHVCQEKEKWKLKVSIINVTKTNRMQFATCGCATLALLAVHLGPTESILTVDSYYEAQFPIDFYSYQWPDSLLALALFSVSHCTLIIIKIGNRNLFISPNFRFLYGWIASSAPPS